MKETIKGLKKFIDGDLSLHHDINNLRDLFKLTNDKMNDTKYYFVRNGYKFVHFIVVTMEFYVSGCDIQKEKVKRMKTAKEMCRKLLYILTEFELDERNIILLSEMEDSNIKKIINIINEIYETCQKLRKELGLSIDDGTKLYSIINDKLTQNVA